MKKFEIEMFTTIEAMPTLYKDDMEFDISHPCIILGRDGCVWMVRWDGEIWKNANQGEMWFEKDYARYWYYLPIAFV
jgi:hypothetical protein